MSERHLRLIFQLRSPTCIAQRPTTPGALARSLDFLSGTVVRGGIAARWLNGRSYADLDDAERRQFGALFLSERVRFGNALPFSPKGTIEVVPRTAWSAKRRIEQRDGDTAPRVLRGGWRGDDDAGVRDVLTLLLQPLDEQTAQNLADLDPLEHEFTLRQGGLWKRHRPKRRLISRTALASPVAQGDRSRELADEGQLYSFEAIDTREQFAGVIAGESELVESLSRLLAPPDKTGESVVLRMGQGRSRGMGQVFVAARDFITPVERDTVQLAEAAARFSARAGAPDGRIYLPITLEADAILRDRYLLPCSSADPRETLARYLPDPPPSMRLREAIQSTRWIGGWDDIRRVPRAAQLAVTLGSVWVFELGRDELRAGIDWWLVAERRGLGERCGEGYGRVRLLHPLHMEARDLW